MYTQHTEKMQESWNASSFCSWFAKWIFTGVVVILLCVGPHSTGITASATRESFADKLEQRAVEYVTKTHQNSYSIIGDAARVHAGYADPILSSNYENAIEELENLVDCADFNIPALMWLLYSPENAYSSDLRNSLKTALVGWKYWIDEHGGAGAMHVWTENHAMNFHTAEYLVGSLYPDDIFDRSGLTGAEHANLGRTKLMNWLTRRWRWGFSEWRSTTYMRFDVASVATLAALAPETEVATRAARVLDLLLYDSAVHTFKGQHASSSGRILGYNIEYAQNPPQHEVLNWLLGGQGRTDSGDSHSVVAVALLVTRLSQSSPRYSTSNALLAIAAGVDDMDAFMVRERIGIGPEDLGLALDTGLTLNTVSDAFTWMGLGCYTHPMVVPLIVKAANTYSLFSDDGASSIFDIWKFLQEYSESEQHDLLANRLPLTYFGTLGPAETVYWRTKHAALASVTNYRKAAIGDQQRAWRATLGNGTAAVYTTYPGPGISVSSGALQQLIMGGTFQNYSMAGSDDNAAGYWVGSASLPRIGQYENAAIILYRPPPQLYQLLGSFVYPYAYTHAAFPFHLFDEVVDELETYGRIAARAGDGYIALWSASGTASVVTSGEYADLEVVSPTGPNGTAAWGCVVGDSAKYGVFNSFVESVLRGGSFAVTDNVSMSTTFSWGDGKQRKSMSFGWESELLVADSSGVIATENVQGYGRFESPFTSAVFPAPDSISITYGGFVDELNFASGKLTTRFNADPSKSTSSVSNTTAVAIIAVVIILVGGTIYAYRQYVSKRRPTIQSKYGSVPLVPMEDIY